MAWVECKGRQPQRVDVAIGLGGLCFESNLQAASGAAGGGQTCLTWAEAAESRSRLRQLPYGVHALAALAKAMRGVPGESSLRALWAVVVLGAVPSIVLAVAWLTRAWSGWQVHNRRQLVMAAAGAVGLVLPLAAAIAVLAGGVPAWLSQPGEWQSFEQVLDPEMAASCSIGHAYQGLELAAAVCLAVELVLVYALSTGVDTGQCFCTCEWVIRGQALFEQPDGNAVGCCAPARIPVRRFTTDSLHQHLCNRRNRETSDALLDMHVQPCVRTFAWLALWPLALSVIAGVVSSVSPVLRVKGSVCGADATYSAWSEQACVTTTSGAAAALDFATSDCFVWSQPRRLVLLSPANGTLPTERDISNVVLPVATASAHAAQPLLAAFTASAAVALAATLALALCNMEGGLAYRLFRWWGPVAAIALAVAGTCSPVFFALAAIERDAMRTAIFAEGMLPDLESRSASDRPVGSGLVSPFGFPLHCQPAAISETHVDGVGLFSPVLANALIIALWSVPTAVFVLLGLRLGSRAPAAVSREGARDRPSGAGA